MDLHSSLPRCFLPFKSTAISPAIAIGTAKLFNVDLMQNFKAPYFSSSIREFWSRWHISLSSWLRDYVYIPLGGSRVSKPRHIRNLLITFFVSGIWHGANYTYIIWGALHGLLQSLETLLPSRACVESSGKKRIHAIRILLTFFLCCFCWIFFRANSLADAWHIVTHLLAWEGGIFSTLLAAWSALGMTLIDAFSIGCALLVLLSYDLASVHCDVITLIGKLHTWKRWIIYLLFMLFMLFLIPAHSSGAFVYFQF